MGAKVEKTKKREKEDKPNREGFQAKIKPEVRDQIKYRANQLRITIGGYLENVVNHVELRLESAYKELGVIPGIGDDLVLKTILNQYDVIDKEKLEEALRKEGFYDKASNKLAYKPTITV